MSVLARGNSRVTTEDEVIPALWRGYRLELPSSAAIASGKSSTPEDVR